MKKFISFIVLFALFIGPSCFGQQDTGEPSEAIAVITGTVKHFSYEDGFYGIEGDDGTTYKPLRLSPGFQREGLRVKARARIIEKKFLFKGWGTPIEIIEIERER